MRQRTQLVPRIMIAALLAGLVTLGACSSRYGDYGAYYDPWYSDYHYWNGSELGYYGRWENEARLPHVSFRLRPELERHSYYTWRHRR